MKQRALTLFPIGGAGVGKSHFLNLMIGKPDYFLASKSTASGLTKTISHFEGP
jgi:GTP-binding protein EngB required for normal cell division